MIRETLPRATIITFWHIPWPSAERIGICPWREELISGILGSSVVGFHTQQHCNNFIDSVDAFMESRIDREAHAVVQGGRSTLVRPYPISIEWPVRWLEDAVPIHQARVDVRRELGLAPDALLGVGVDRLDYTKGIEERLSGGRRAAAPQPGVPRPVHLPAAGRAQPHQDRALPRAERARRAPSPSRSTTRGASAPTGPSSCSRRTTSRRRCSATIAPPISAT